MGSGRVLWVIWCLVWVLVWLVLAGHDAAAWSSCQHADAVVGHALAACDQQNPQWGPAAGIALAVASGLAILLPVGKPRASDQELSSSGSRCTTSRE